MSLPAIAKQLEAKGRHGDTNLVHVSDSELKGLHAIAAAHGKKITINPETGLPEAFSLKSFLPTIIGAGLSIASGGALTPLMAAGITGAGYGVATGSLQKGLMAGLGAYGGAGLAGSLAGTGAAVAPGAVTPPVGGAPAAVPDVTAAMPGNHVAANFGGANQFSNYAAQTGVSNPVLQNGLTQSQSSLLGMPSPPVASVSQTAANTAAPSWTQAAGNQWDKVSSGAGKLYEGGWDATSKFLGENKMNIGTALAPVLTDAMTPAEAGPGAPTDKGMIRPYTFAANQTGAAEQDANPVFGQTAPRYDTVAGLGDTSEQTHFAPTYTAEEPYAAARGGIVGMALGGPVERDAAVKAVGMNTEFPMAHIETPIYANPQTQRPDAREVVNPSGDVGVDMFTGEPRMASGGIARYGSGGSAAVSTKQDSSSSGAKSEFAYDPKSQKFTETITTPPPVAQQPFRGLFGIPGLVPMGGNTMMSGGPLGLLIRDAQMRQQQQQQPIVTTRVTGGIMDPYMPEEQQDMANGGVAGGYNLGGYSDGGRLLKGPGDGVSDSIPASIGGRQPARLADGEFVVPARIVSELGNGSTEAGARKLYAMMDRVQKGRRKTVGKGKVAVNSRSDKHLPA